MMGSRDGRWRGVALAGVLMLSAGCQGQRDAAAINAARHVVVRAIDPALPRVSFEAWLRGVVGTAAATNWEVNDCGEHTGNPRLDQGRDFPLCAEVQVGFGDQRELHVSLVVGSFKKGVRGTPGFWMAYITKAGGPPEWIEGLAEIPSAARRLAAVDRLPIE